LPGGWDTVPTTRHADGTCEARLIVDGLRCASCVWLTERLLQSTPGVAEAMVSYATGRAVVRWHPEQTDLTRLAGRIASLGYRPRLLGEEAVPDRSLLLRLGVATFAALNIMLMSVALYAGWMDSMAPRFVALFHWASLVLATPVALWCAEPFFRGAVRGLRHRSLHMDLPIALTVAVLNLHGLVATVTGGDPYFDSLAMLVALLLAGRILEGRGRRRTAEAAVSLAASVPATARRVRGTALDTVPADQLDPGDVVVVAAGEELPADGVVLDGAGLVRMALVTGEAEPVTVGPGTRVVAGTVMEAGSLSLRVEAAGRDTVVQGMVAELENAAERPVRASSTDRIAPWFTAGTLGIAAATFGGWWLAADLSAGILAAVAVLVVACPCALALSRPLAAAAGLGAAARRGILFRSADALLDLDSIDLVALDKTGTVTRGEYQVVRADDSDLRIAAGLERFSSHPVARAVVEETAARGIPLPRGRDVVEEPGAGIRGIVDGRRWWLGAGAAGELELREEGSAGVGHRGPIALGDRVREDSAAVVAALGAAGFGVVLLSGDHPAVARRVGAAAGIDSIEAPLAPGSKARWIRGRQERGHQILFAGDGINDGPALAQADVAVAMGTGAAASVLAADAVISVPSLAPLLAGLRASQAARRAIRANQIRSIGYNVLAVAGAAAGLINPLVAALLMPLSSAVVIGESARVERVVSRAEQ